ncbi:hypothetical protein ACPYO6_10500 [Georgenia sp. Z1344]|uniref:hypothetical protein n=1 Tax=Georgenia sp. Z1344 TaxID=3416706 RepID=UPI003CF5432C
MTHPHDDEIDPTVAVPGSMAAQVRASRRPLAERQAGAGAGPAGPTTTNGAPGGPGGVTAGRSGAGGAPGADATAPLAPVDAQATGDLPPTQAQGEGAYRVPTDGSAPTPGRGAFDSAATPQDPGAQVSTAEIPALSEPAPTGWGPGGQGGPGWQAGPPPGGPGFGPSGPGGPGYGPGGPGPGAQGAPYGPGAPYAPGRPPSGAAPYPGPRPAGTRNGLPPANGAVVTLSVLWRLAVAALAIWALYETLVPVYEAGGWEGVGAQLTFFTTVNTILVALVMVLSVLRVLGPGPARNRLEGRHGWFRGMVTTYSVMTSVVFITLLEGALDERLSLVVHLVLPVAMVLDWLVVGRNQDRVPGYWPVLWVLPMFAYLALYMWQSDRWGYAIYPFVDPGASDFVSTVAFLLGGWLACGYLVWGIGRARGAVLGR